MINLLIRNYENLKKNDMNYLPNAGKFFEKVDEKFWILRSNLLGFLQIIPTNFFEISKLNDIFFELNSEEVLWKVILIKFLIKYLFKYKDLKFNNLHVQQLDRI